MKNLIYLAGGAFILSISACNSSQKAVIGNKIAVALPAFNKEGHRGTRGLMPENTIQAMYKAIDFGVNTVEVDVVYSKDNKVVISHDVYFHPDITTTPDGKFLTAKDAQKHALYEMDYDSIKKYDVGLKPHPGFSKQANSPAYKPLLGELIDSTDWYAKLKGQPILYNIELKSNPAYDGVKTPPVEQFVDGVMKVVKEKKIENRCYLQSFDFRSMQVVHRKYPGIVTAILISDKDKRTLTQQIQELGYTPEMYSPHYSLVTAGLVAECHNKNIKIIPWTVNSVEEMRKMKLLGVDGIITDYPDYFAQL